ncbi:phospholipase D-like domain-containing protein [Sphingomonas sp. ID0503]|uniref:phospholipase D-like domain-containing protein n=1 Tax=Sphingomonas sp. ID0503 TaxID=3399691 RepID=UPI003AFA871D
MRLSPKARRLLAAIIVPALLIVGLVAALAWRADDVEDVTSDLHEPTLGRVYFGGPDRPAGALRNLLLQRVRAMPAGQSIDWATYYFLDPELARALIAASRRGVRVRLIVEGDPRFEAANDAVISMLKKDGLRGGLTIRSAYGFPLNLTSGKLHAKIYAFSWPKPVALVGSFNPSGGAGDDDAATIREIGDQDRGHNMLVEVVSPGLVDALVRHVGALAKNGGSVGRFSAENNRIVRAGDTQLYFYPRIHTDIVESALDHLGEGDHLYAAISHLKGDAVGTLEDAVERGATVDLIVHDTERRVPQRAVDRLRNAGVSIRRYRHRDKLPMHDKFFIIENDDRWVTFFGSLNFNRNSRLLNDELLVRSTNPVLARTLLARFRELDREVDGQ